jgi:hypothetical protein
MKKNQGTIGFISAVLTYLITHIVYKLTGFYYNFGQLNYKLLVDILLWCSINLIVYKALKRMGVH